MSYPRPSRTQLAGSIAYVVAASTLCAAAAMALGENGKASGWVLPAVAAAHLIALGVLVHGFAGSTALRLRLLAGQSRSRLLAEEVTLAGILGVASTLAVGVLLSLQATPLTDVSLRIAADDERAWRGIRFLVMDMEGTALHALASFPGALWGAVATGLFVVAARLTSRIGALYVGLVGRTDPSLTMIVVILIVATTSSPLTRAAFHHAPWITALWCAVLAGLSYGGLRKTAMDVALR